MFNFGVQCKYYSIAALVLLDLTLRKQIGSAWQAHLLGCIGTHPYEEAFLTANGHPRDRFDYWRSVGCKTFVGHSSKPACQQTFEAEIATGMLADIGLILLANSPMDVAPHNAACRSI
jgi:hypothetical protein